MPIQVAVSGQSCGAAVTGIDLTRALPAEEINAIRAAWLEYHVLSFPQQNLSDDDLERFSLYFGSFGDDPFIAPIPGRKHIIAVERRADETAPLFAESWHTDWSFQKIPPSGTCLFAITIPAAGGDTWFNNQHKVLDAMPASLRARLDGKMAIHSAKGAYAPDGMYGEADQASDRSMDIRPSAQANETRSHPLIRTHPETGQPGIFGCLGYIVGIEGMPDAQAFELLMELHEWQTRPEFRYRHQWQENMLVMWDNRSVLHRATGGYEGHNRLLHRTTIAGMAA